MLCNEKFELRRKLNRAELDRFLATPSRRLEVVFRDLFTERIIENVLCKSFRVLNGTKTVPWCDTLLPDQPLPKEGLKTTKSVLSKWIGARGPIPRKRKYA